MVPGGGQTDINIDVKPCVAGFTAQSMYPDMGRGPDVCRSPTIKPRIAYALI